MDIKKSGLTVSPDFFEFKQSQVIGSVTYKYRGSPLIFMGHDDIFLAGHPHEKTGKYAVIDIETRHIDEWMPFAVTPGKINVFCHILFAILLADVAISVEILTDLFPLLLVVFPAGSIDSLGSIGIHGFQDITVFSGLHFIKADVF